MNRERLLGIVKGNSKHPMCTMTIMDAVDKYVVSKQEEAPAPDGEADDIYTEVLHIAKSEWYLPAIRTLKEKFCITRKATPDNKTN